MSVERDGGGGSGSGKTASFTASEGVITYKRRKRGLGDSGGELLGDPSVSSVGQKPMEELHGTLICNGAHEVGGPANMQRHWKMVLEQLLLSQGVSDLDAWSCIEKALVSGHLSFTKKSSTHAAQANYIYEANGNLRSETKRSNNFLKAIKKHADSSSVFWRDSSGQADFCVISKKCQNVLIEVLLSEKFALLCDLLLENFPGIKADSIIDLSLINSKMKNGAYGPSTGLFQQDLQQVWERIQKIGTEMALLATSLSNISQASCQSQGGEELGVGISEQEYQKPSEVGTEEKNSMDSHTTTQFPCESHRSTKPEQTEASGLYKVSICKECGLEVDSGLCLICDECEATYHFSCMMPDVQGMPTKWYCPLCTKDKREFVEHNITNASLDRQHQNCAVCDRLKDSGMIEQPTKEGGQKATTQFPCESHRSTKPEQTEASGLYKVSICKECGLEADSELCLICDECEATYHFSCMMPDVQGMPTKWYCPLCKKDKREFVEHNITNASLDRQHQNCAVCDRLKDSGMIEQPTKEGLENATTNESRESSVSSMDSEGSPRPSRTLRATLCKICGTCEDEERRFIVCGHSLCLYKYYHIRCLKSSQVAIQPQEHQRGCWYCPSCLCRACLKDKDDNMIVMCDGCDEAYHMYCMKPPRTSVPRGKWYCVPCNIRRAKQGMKKYEQWVLQQHTKTDENRSNGLNRSMDILVSAVEKVESMSAVKKNR